MLKLKITGLPVALAALTCVLAPASAEAARATFSVKLEAHKTVTWDHPRVLLGGSCTGQNYAEGRGSEDFKLTSKAGGRLVVEGNAKRVTTWEFGTEGDRKRLIASVDPEAKGVITRTRRWVTGRTGGWCGGAQQDPVKPGDCGTRLAPYTFRMSLTGGRVGFRESLGYATNEKYGFYDCRLDTPEGMPETGLPSLEKKLPLAKLFSGQKTITIDASKSYGPTLTPLPGGQNRTASASYTYKLTLKRVKNLKPRSENG